MGVDGGLSARRMRTQCRRRRNHWLVFLGLGESEQVLTAQDLLVGYVLTGSNSLGQDSDVSAVL